MFSLSLAVAMEYHGERASGAAQRRRERRLRAWQRHVRTAVQLALAEKLHHSAGPVEQHDALRRQKNARVRQEGEEHGTYDAPRGLSAPLPGTRPARRAAWTAVAPLSPGAGYGFFYVRLFCPGFGFQANIVEEHVLFSAFILLVNVRLYVNACYAVSSDVAALVVVTAVACLLLVCW